MGNTGCGLWFELFTKKLLSIFLSLTLIIPWLPPVFGASNGVDRTKDRLYALQAADTLGIRREVEQLLNTPASEIDESVSLKAKILARIMSGVFQVRVACNSVERELVYTYDLLQKEQKRLDDVDAIFNLLNFAQFATFYSMEGFARLNDDFFTSNHLTSVSAGLSTGIPTVGIITKKFIKVNAAPSEGYRHIVSGSAVNRMRFPKYVEKFLNSRAPGSPVTRREQMHSVWAERYGTNGLTRDAMLSLLDGKWKNSINLNNRIVHLWSIHTFIQDFDYELLSLLKLVRSTASHSTTYKNVNLKAHGFTPDMISAAKLLDIEGELDELIELNNSPSDSTRRRVLEVHVLGHILEANLEMRAAVDKIYEELNYSYDVVLSQLLREMGKKLQLTYEANFIQQGVFGSIAGLLFNKGETKAGNIVFMLLNTYGIALTSLSVLLSRGGKRKIDTPPNSLADFFGLNPNERHRFSKFVSDYLNSRDPASKDGLSNKEELFAIWKRHKVATVNFKKKKIQEKLAAMPSVKNDTIKITQNRVQLLTSLRVRLQLFDKQLLELITATNPSTRISVGEVNKSKVNLDSLKLKKHAQSAAELLNLSWNLAKIKSLDENSQELLDQKLYVTRKIMSAMLEVRKTSSNIEQEIAFEKTAMDRLKRYRDRSITYTNIFNFYQIGILGVIIDGPLGLSRNPVYSGVYNPRLTIISGVLSGSLAGLAFIERPGGIRLKKPEPNMLGPCFNINSSAKLRYAPLLLKYLDSVSPDSSENLTRKQELIEYWQNSKVLRVDITNPKNHDKVSATGKHHHWWQERIKLIRSRANMLYDLRSVVNLMERDLSFLASQLD